MKFLEQDLLQCLNLYRIHISESHILACHCPYEGVACGCHTAVNAPGGRDDSLFIIQENMPCFVWFTHKVDDTLAFRKVKIKIGFHSAIVEVRWHGIPDTSFPEVGYTQNKLAALDSIHVDIFIDHTVIIIVETT